jgi:hypothetical protein
MLTEQLLEEIAAGQGETLTHAASRMPRTRLDKPVTLGCLFRWIMAGVRGADGTQIYLEAARLAGKWITTPGAIRRFVAAQTPPRGTASAAPSPGSPTARQRAAARAAEKLRQVGI